MITKSFYVSERKSGWPWAASLVQEFLNERRKGLLRWLREPSSVMTRLCATEDGEVFTRLEVVTAHGVVALVVLACCAAEWIASL